MNEQITIAVSKGRIFKETLPLLAAAGIDLVDDPDTCRKLVLDTNRDDVKIVIIRTIDVPTYVEYGAADIGVSGSDILAEFGGNGLYEPLDLKIAKCRMMLAGPDVEPDGFKRMRIATKYVNTARKFYAAKGQQIETIKLYGSMELAPIVGLADRIVDLVDTGRTLKENGLKPLELISEVSSRMVVNKASMKMKHKKVQTLIEQVSKAVEERA